MNVSAQIQQEVDFSKIMFLIADEKPFFRDMIHTALTRAGARDIKHATNVEKAMEVMARFGQQIGCVICDWDMAPVGGLELLRMVRGKILPKTPPRTAFVILTARADADAVKAAMAMDVNGFAVAPLSFEKLVKTITNAINRTWVLQSPAHYAAVPPVETSYVPPSKAHVVARELYKRSEVEEAAPVGARHAPSPVATAKAQRRRSAAELINVHMCVLADVRPGDIVARDIKDREGHLLLSAGTELKATLIDRIKDVAGGQDDSYHVWVGEWEPAT